MADLRERLPSPRRLRDLSVTLSILDIAMSPEGDPEDRYLRFDPLDASGVALASMDNGSGDRNVIAFTEDAVFGWGFAHGDRMNPFTRTPVALWPDLLDGMPAQFHPLIQDVRFQLAETFMAQRPSGPRADSGGAPEPRRRVQECSPARRCHGAVRVVASGHAADSEAEPC